MTFKTCLLISALLFSNSLFAHDVWLEAAPFYAKPGENVDISLRVGSDMVGEEMPNLISWYTDFSFFGPDGRQDVPGEMARLPAGFVSASKASTVVVGYRSTTTGLELNAEKFTPYLKQEGLEKIITLRQQQGSSDDIGKERFSRAVKTLVNFGTNDSDDLSQQEFGYTLEITPQQNPYRLNIGDILDITLKYEGKPLPDALITAFTKDLPDQKQQLRTDHLGQASIMLDRQGIWLIKAVEMIAINHEKYDWESFWASLTFQLH